MRATAIILITALAAALAAPARAETIRIATWNMANLHHVLGEGAAEVEAMLSWDKPGDPPRTAADVLHGLDLTWRLITSSLTRREATDEVSDEDVLLLQTIWGLIDHDLPHAGELSLLLGAYGLPAVEI